MSDKMLCPGCDSYTSSVLAAVSGGRPCPYCGLSAEVVLKVEAVRLTKADEALKAKCEEALKRADEAERAVQMLRGVLRNIWNAMPSDEAEVKLYLFGSVSELAKRQSKNQGW